MVWIHLFINSWIFVNYVIFDKKSFMFWRYLYCLNNDVKKKQLSESYNMLFNKIDWIICKAWRIAVCYRLHYCKYSKCNFTITIFVQIISLNAKFSYVTIFCNGQIIGFGSIFSKIVCLKTLRVWIYTKILKFPSLYFEFS